VPVPGAKSGSTPSMSSERWKGRMPFGSIAFIADSITCAMPYLS